MSLLTHGIVNRCLRETCPETDVGITVVPEVYGPPKAQAQFFFDNNGIARARPHFRRASSELPGLPVAILLYSDARWAARGMGFTSCKDPLIV
jgi:hypothetical protein